jgi:hypothetical protein
LISLCAYAEDTDQRTAARKLQEELALAPSSATRPVKRRHIQRAVHADALQRLCKARRLWGRRQPLTGSVAQRYMRSARGYDGPLPPTLGFLPANDKYPPAIIAAFAFADEPEPGILTVPDHAVRAVHITRLLPDGSDRVRTCNADKPDKFMVGPVCGTPIVLAPTNDAFGLAITEGIEDGLSVHAATGLGVWAAGSASFMPALAEVVPTYIECVTIYQHDDEAGRRGSTALADTLTARGVEVLISSAGV